MSDDLIKRLGKSVWTLDEAENRIEQLEREIDELSVLTGMVKDGLEAKLTKAVSLALEECPYGYGTGGYNDWWYERRTTLAELEGK